MSSSVCAHSARKGVQGLMVTDSGMAYQVPKIMHTEFCSLSMSQ